jgi:hypothetical protein
MIRCPLLFCLLALGAAYGWAGVMPVALDRTATVAPLRLPLEGKWQRVDTAYEHELLIVGRGGRVLLGESGHEASARCLSLSADTIQLDFDSLSGYGRRLRCRWRLQDDALLVEIVASMSRADRGAEFNVLDVDRSLLGETWRFRRAR